MSIRAALAAIGLTVLGSVSAATATAAVRTVAETPRQVEQGPFLVGDRVAWSDLRCVRDCFAFEGESDRVEVRVSRPRLRPSVLARAFLPGDSSGGPNSFSRGIEFAVTRNRFALLTTENGSEETSGDFGRFALRAGGLGDPLALIYRCGWESDPAQPPVFGLAGDSLAYERDPCRGAAPAIVVRDLATGAEQAFPQPTGSYVQYMSIDGNSLALVRLPSTQLGQGSELVVYDLRTARETNRIAIAKDRDVGSIDVAADGTVAAVTGPTRTPAGRDFGCPDGRIEVYAAGVHEPRRLANRVCPAVTLAGDNVLHLTGGSQATALKAVTLDGRRRRTLANWGRVGRRAFDADDRRFALGLRRCAGGFAFLVGAIGDPTVRAGSARCPVAVRAPRRLRTVDGHVGVRLGCSRGCAGTVRLKLGRKRLAARLVRVERGASGRLRLSLGRGARALLRRRGALPVTIEARTLDRDDRVRSARRLAILSP